MRWKTARKVLWAVLVIGITAASITEGATVKGLVRVSGPNGEPRSGRETGIVVWLSPLSSQPGASPRNSEAPRSKIVQRNKRFETRLLAVQVGSVVEFPNLDPFFHNVFSLFDGKQFDLGLYEAGSTRSVRFDRPGVCFIFCNIHSQMSAAVVVVDTPYFTVLNTPGEFEIPRVPAGRYQLNVWAERCSPETLKEFSRPVTIAEDSAFVGAIQLRESRQVVGGHSNKYGKDYDPQVFSSPIYARP
jgi:plastocyanin